ncbi:hypothetical protein SCLCIDRAFT_1209646 [Scleroderma citrinum Foug A]|uniref:Uncharacterized protein n=1 Tax=Scleroderma citrinum Foug A TaxID=1036808 RepID=A0A0C3EJ15_9AGAM|nr:hypothetical protein SCLCIDRAFT_1209646 [Scleroderma citrinum Foug A]
MEKKSPQEVTIGSETGTGALAAIDGAHPHDIERKSLKEVSEICTEALAAIDGAHPLDIERIGNTSESARKFPQEVIDGFEAGATLAVLDGAQPLDIEKNENTSESARKSPHEATIGSETGSGALAVLDGTHSHDIERNDPTRQYIVLIAILFTSVLGLYYFL